MSLPKKLGLVAGGGQAPRQLLDFCLQTGRPVFVFCLEGQAAADLPGDTPHAWLPLGAASELVRLVKEQGVEEIVLLGRVRRPSLLELKPDLLAMKVLAASAAHLLGDDGLLVAVGKTLEKETGARVVAAQEVFGGFLTPAGCLTSVAPDADAEKDLLKAAEMARELGRLDIGQAVVVQQGLVLGVEAIEGTDALIARAGALQRDGARGVLVKMAKPQQDARFDLPSIGPDTVRALQASGLRGVGIESGRSLLISSDETIDLAQKAGIFIVGLT